MCVNLGTTDHAANSVAKGSAALGWNNDAAGTCASCISLPKVVSKLCKTHLLQSA